VKFAVWAAMCGDASAMVGWGPVHLMPARTMRPSPPRMYRLHCAAPAAAPAVPVAAVAGSGVLASCCAKGVMASKQNRMASQLAAAQAPGRLQIGSRDISRAGAARVSDSTHGEC
jgi:hypothetical protein